MDAPRADVVIVETGTLLLFIFLFILPPEDHLPAPIDFVVKA
jgi:hypothetical protein